MGQRDERNEEIRRFITANVREHPRDIAGRVAERFGISRQAAARHVQRQVEGGVIAATGTTRDRSYELIPIARKLFSYPIGPETQEDRVWRVDVAPLLKGLPKNVYDICNYGLTEMVNNALEHSEGTAVEVGVVMWADQVKLQVVDDGVGIFNKIQRECGLDDPMHAILELSKGKLTTDPRRHSGEGIFFTSRAFDKFSIMSGRLTFIHGSAEFDALVENPVELEVSGTAVLMEISAEADGTMNSVFDAYSVEPEEFGFDRTVVPVLLAQHGDENLVSRSQARRLMSRLGRFREVVLNFDRVASIGQAFADEVFRVFPLDHPDTKLIPINANVDITRMIARVRRADQDTERS